MALRIFMQQKIQILISRSLQIRCFERPLICQLNVKFGKKRHSLRALTLDQFDFHLCCLSSAWLYGKAMGSGFFSVHKVTLVRVRHAQVLYKPEL